MRQCVEFFSCVWFHLHVRKPSNDVDRNVASVDSLDALSTTDLHQCVACFIQAPFDLSSRMQRPIDSMTSAVPQDKDNRSLVSNSLCCCIDHWKCIEFMVVNTSDVCCLAALEDNFGIVAKCATIRSSVYQCTSLAPLDRMLGCMNLVRSALGFPILLGLACSNSADVAFQLAIGMLIRCVRRHHRLVCFGGI